MKGFLDGEQSPGGEATGNLTEPGSAPTSGKQRRDGSRDQKLPKKNNFMRKHSRTEANPKGLWRSLASGHQHSQGPNTQLKAFIGKENRLKSGPQYPHCLKQLGPPPESPGKKGPPNWPSEGSGIEVKVNTFGVVELSTRGIQLPAINTIREVAFIHPGLHLGAGEGPVQLSITFVLPLIFPHHIH